MKALQSFSKPIVELDHPVPTMAFLQQPHVHGTDLTQHVNTQVTVACGPCCAWDEDEDRTASVYRRFCNVRFASRCLFI